MFRLWGSDKKKSDAESPNAAGADVPIKRATDDLLNRAVLAKRIASLLSATGSREGRVFAIRGGWGFGKSSLKNLVIEALEEGGNTNYLDFNPWQWGDSESISRALFSQMASRLGGGHSPENAKRAKALRRYGTFLVGGSGSLNKAGDDKGLSTALNSIALVAAACGIGFPSLPVKLLAAGALGLAAFALAIGKLLKWLGRDRSDIALDDVRTDLEERLSRLSCPLVVFVDDIDRLEPDQVRLVFRQIKANANLPNIIFVLLFQPSTVERALEPVSGGEGRQFLEKIVQSHFDLPPVAREQLFQIFGAQLSQLIGDLANEANGFENRRWGNIALGGIQPFIRNLRDVSRLLASIDFILPMHRGPRAFEVNILDFVGLEVLRVFEPDFHAALAPHRELLLQSRRYRDDQREANDRNEMTALLAIASDENREACSELIKELFPPVEWALGGTNYSGTSWAQGWAREKRVCTSRSFDRYFALQLPAGAMSESDFVDLAEASTDPANLSALLTELRDRGLLNALASRLDESVEELPTEGFENLLATMLLLGEELGQQTSIGDVFNTPFLACWRAASWYIRRLPDIAGRAQALIRTMSATKCLAVPAVLISLDVDRRVKPESGDVEPAFDDAGLEQLKAAWVKLMGSRAADVEAMLGNKQLLSHLYRWRDLAKGGIAAPRRWVSKVSKDDSQLAKLLVQFLSVGSQQAWGDRVAVKSESFRRDTLTDFFNLKRLEARLPPLVRAETDPERLRILKILEWHFDRWRDGKSTDP